MARTLRLAAIFLASAALVIGTWLVVERAQKPHPDGQNGDSTSKPTGKLIVLVVFDQMRGDYLARWAEQFGPNGFERMKKNGVWYSDVHLPYACSSTGPGHASIGTGAPPSIHGIIENQWYDRPSSSLVYCVQPTRPYELVPPPPKNGKASRGSENGFSPERLLAETIGDRLQAASEKSRVVSLSIKDRTAVLLGGKKPTAAYCFDTRDGLFHTDTYYRDAVHPWIADFNASGKVKEWIGKEWTHFRTDIDYDKLVGRDDAAGEAFGVTDASFGQKRVFPHPFPSKEQFEAKPKTYYSCVEISPAGNDLLFDLAKKAIVAENLGNTDATDLLCVSFSSNDLIGHIWGPDSQEVLDITLRSDKMIAEFLAYLDEKLGDRYAMVITADHGICPLPEQKRIETAARKTLADIFPPLG
ncbi:MAG TPA: alkaline phosphatase family protein, partial [Urbifossiella sp.]